ncbi:MAG TPA: NAD(P)H-hydrate dehydratase [Pseudolabrys sp.]|nr:NAD(P)H-hydrate dehydratase [Pseudolabrys sp.]
MELLTTAEIAQADRLTIAGGTSGIDLMERAGRAVADAVARLPAGRVLVIAGQGNNGGDGFVAARHLAERDREVSIAFLGDRDRLKGDAATAAARWKGAISKAVPDLIGNHDVIVDALFGAGLDREVTGAARGMIEAMNASGLPIVAIDLPSGVNGTSGAVLGLAVQALRTVTFFRPKTGHFLLPGRLCCGSIEVADIGIPENVLETIKPASFLNLPALWKSSFPKLDLGAHKYTRGHVVVLSGGVSTTGAARLAARGALRAGAGLVTIASPNEALAVNAAANLAIMVRPVDDVVQLAEFLRDKRRNAVVLGPGGGVGDAMREYVRATVKSGASTVLDADALTSFAGDPSALAAVIRERSGAVVLTPHAGEFGRLFSSVPGISQAASKLDRARAAAAFLGAVVVYKGADTVVAEPDGRAAIAANAPASLATAGSGDVLAGMICGLLAQGMAAFEAACAAVWLHGEAANEFGPGLISEDLPELLPRIYRKLWGANQGEAAVG